MKNLVEKLNEELDDEYRIRLDAIRESPRKPDDGTRVLAFLGFAETINHDTTSVPEDIKLKVSNNKSLNNILLWINKKIFTAALNYLKLGKKVPQFLELVRIRIVSNMILNQRELTRVEQEEWIMQIQNVFYARKRVMLNYYFTNIEHLPF